jgi:hypothetical protein
VIGLEGNSGTGAADSVHEHRNVSSDLCPTSKRTSSSIGPVQYPSTMIQPMTLLRIDAGSVRTLVLVLADVPSLLVIFDGRAKVTG